MDRETVLKDFYEDYEEMRPHLERLKGYKLYLTKVEKLEDWELEKVLKWLVGLQGSKEWKAYRQICFELSDAQYRNYRAWDQQDFPEFQAFIQKRFTMREKWNATIPSSVIKAGAETDQG